MRKHNLTLSGCNVLPVNLFAHNVSKLVVLWIANNSSFTSISLARLDIIFASSFLKKKKKKKKGRKKVNIMMLNNVSYWLL